MIDEEKKVVEDEQEESYYDEVRADIETAVYAYSTLLEIDMGMQPKSVQKQIDEAKKDCITIMCKALDIIRKSYEEE